MVIDMLVSYIEIWSKLRHEVTCGKTGITSTERARCLEMIQLVAFLKTAEEHENQICI